VPAFQVRVFRTEEGYLAWIDGLGTVEGRTLTDIRREARRFIRTVVGGAFPDRPRIDPAGATEVLQFDWEVRLCKCLPAPDARRPAGVRILPRVHGADSHDLEPVSTSGASP